MARIREQLERQRISDGDPRDVAIGFAFGRADPSPERVDRLITTLNHLYGTSLQDPATRITVRVGASRPGSAADNLRLSQKRGENLKQELVKAGVRAAILVEAVGESEARTGPTRMALDHPPATDEESADRHDAAGYRIAVLEVEVPTRSVEMDTVTLRQGEDIFEKTFDAGRLIFNQVVKPFAEEVRDHHKLRPNPFGEDPSEDPVKLGRQILHLGKDAVTKSKGDVPGGVFMLLGKYTVGTAFEAMVRNKWREQVADERRPYFEAIADGVGAGVDESFQPRARANADEQRLLDRVREATRALTPEQKEQMDLYLQEMHRRGTADLREPAFSNLRPEVYGGTAASNTSQLFEGDRHFRSD